MNPSRVVVRPGHQLVSLNLILLLTIGLFTTTTRGDEIIMKNGDTMRGVVISESGSAVTFDHADLGRMEIPLERIDTLKISEQADMPVLDNILPPAEPAPPPKEWSLTISLALNNTTGNTDEQSIRVGFDAIRKREKTRLGFDVVYFFERTDGRTSDNKFSLGGRHDWLNPGSRLFWFVNGRFDNDEFESWQQRFSAHGGPGYHILYMDDTGYEMELDGRLGIGLRREWGSLNDDLKLEAQIGVDYEWIITERQRFVVTANYFPVLDDFDDFRTFTRANWSWAVSTDFDLALNVGLSHEYQSVVDPGKEKTDLRIWLGLQYGF